MSVWRDNKNIAIIMMILDEKSSVFGTVEKK